MILVVFVGCDNLGVRYDPMDMAKGDKGVQETEELLVEQAEREARAEQEAQKSPGSISKQEPVPVPPVLTLRIITENVTAVEIYQKSSAMEGHGLIYVLHMPTWSYSSWAQYVNIVYADDATPPFLVATINSRNLVVAATLVFRDIEQRKQYTTVIAPTGN